ncbi:MAG: YaeQ family protein, partial [Thermoanaerobaculia bacterium]
LLGQLEKRKIHRGDEIPIYTFDRGFLDEVASRLARRMKISVSVTGGHLYLDIDGRSLQTPIEEHRLPA